MKKKQDSESRRLLTRREFVGGALLGGAGLVLGCSNFTPAGLLARGERRSGPGWRRVWAFADSHVGLGGRANDGRDGADWLRLCLDDLRKNIDSVDYVLGLGDLTHRAGPDNELKSYVRVRDASHLRRWYELAGNHDYAAIPAGRWARYIKRPPRYALIDGTLAWFFISAERGKSDGLVTRRTAEWLTDAIKRHQDKRNIVVCSHQAVRGTVSGSYDEGASLNDPELVRKIFRDVRIDLWLCGHIHAGRRGKGHIRRTEERAYVNIASAGHAYGTRACHGYVLDMAEGSNEMLAKCRDHDHDRYLEDQEVRITFPHAFRFFGEPVVIPAPV